MLEVVANLGLFFAQLNWAGLSCKPAMNLLQTFFFFFLRALLTLFICNMCVKWRTSINWVGNEYKWLQIVYKMICGFNVYTKPFCNTHSILDSMEKRRKRVLQWMDHTDCAESCISVNRCLKWKWDSSAFSFRYFLAQAVRHKMAHLQESVYVWWTTLNSVFYRKVR